MIGVLCAASHEAKRFGDEEVRFLESLSNLLATSLLRMQTEDALNHAQRMESVGQLTGGIAHDFNNMLTVIQGNLQVLEDHPALLRDEHARQLLTAAARATQRGAELTGKLLAFSRRQILQPSTVDTSALLHSLADMLRRTLDQRIHIKVDAHADGIAVRADAVQLESALLNIAINARDAMPDGGILHFAAVRASSPWHISGMESTGESFVSIVVSDSGVGMTEAVKERAFEPFFTTKKVGRGTGLGLSTVYGFVKQSHGGIAIDSSPGNGTSVTLYLPGAENIAPKAHKNLSVKSAYLSGTRVIVVEDDPDVRKVALAFLSSLGCEATEAASAEAALSTMAVESRPFDLLLSDIALGPGMRGTQLASEAKQHFPHIAVLLTSGFPTELLDADRDAPLDWEFLSKPYTRTDLAEAIARALAARA